MHDPCAMRLREAARHLIGDPHRLRGVEAALAVKAHLEVLADEELGHHEETELRVVAGVDDLHDVIALRGGGGLRFAAEARGELGVLVVLHVEELDRDARSEEQIRPLVDDAHRARAEAPLQTEPAGDNRVLQTIALPHLTSPAAATARPKCTRGTSPSASSTRCGLRNARSKRVRIRGRLLASASVSDVL